MNSLAPVGVEVISKVQFRNIGDGLNSWVHFMKLPSDERHRRPLMTGPQ